MVGKTEAGRIHRYWQAAWVDETNHRRTAKFSIERYGEEEALLLAIHARPAATVDAAPPETGAWRTKRPTFLEVQVAS